MLKEFPILGPDSQKASVVSMAFHKMMPEKYGEFHNAAARRPGPRQRSGGDQDRAVARRRRGEAARRNEGPADHRGIFDETYDLANKLSITGTPSYVVGNEVVFGALGQDVLAEKIAARQGARC